MTAIRWISNQELFASFGYARAIEAIGQLLERGFDPASDKQRTFVNFEHGQGLVMPSEIGDFAGLKFVTVAPENPKHNLDRIQGIYSLFDSKTLTPLAQCDGAALTLLRTASVTAAMLQKLKVAESPKLAIFGSGPQALAHILSVKAILSPAAIAIFARNPESRAELMAGLSEQGIEAVAGTPEMLLAADLIVTATTARQPLFTLSEIKQTAVIAAVGSHEADAREVGSDVVAAAQVFVEELGASLREAGDVIMAIQDQAIAEAALIEVRDLFGNNQANSVDETRIRFYKSTGMPWQDLALFSQAYSHLKA